MKINSLPSLQARSIKLSRQLILLLGLIYLTAAVPSWHPRLRDGGQDCTGKPTTCTDDYETCEPQDKDDLGNDTNFICVHK